MKIVVMTDIEGVSGVVSFSDQADGAGRYYEQARHLLTGEVNAAVEAMVAESVSEIVIVDGHGAGGIVFESLHPAARLYHGRPMGLDTFFKEYMSSFDAAMMIGQHAMAGVATGNLNHTQDARCIDHYQLNGRPIGEIAQWALCTGAHNVPMIFISGDQAACDEARELIPSIDTATVKQGICRTSAISYSIAESHRRICEGVTQAIRRHRATPAAPLHWPSPYVLEKRFFHSGLVDGYAPNPLAKIIDAQTVQFHSADLLDIIYI